MKVALGIGCDRGTPLATLARAVDEALTAAGLTVDRTEVRLPNGALRHTGEFNIAVQLHHDVTADVLVTVVAE